KSVDGSISVNGGLSVSALEDVKGTITVYQASGSVFAGNVADASITAYTGLTISAGQEIKNSIGSGNGKVEATVTGATGGGALSATVTAAKGADITNLLGNVT